MVVVACMTSERLPIGVCVTVVPVTRLLLPVVGAVVSAIKLLQLRAQSCLRRGKVHELKVYRRRAVEAAFGGA